MVDAFDPDAYLKSEVPAPAFDPDAYLKATPTAKPEPSMVDTIADVAHSGVTGVGKGLIGLAGLPGDAAGLINRGIDYVGEKLGAKATDPTGYGLMGSGQIRKGIESVTGPLYEPQTTAGHYAQTAGEFLPAVVGGPGSMATKLATRVAAPAVVSEGAGQVFKGTAVEPYARVAGAVTGAVGAAGIASALRSATSPQTNVATDLVRAMKRDGDTTETVLQRLQEAKQIRPEATLADVGGENVKGILERVAQTPGAGRTTVVPALTSRQQAQMGRLSSDLSSLTGTRQSATKAIEETMAARSAEAAPLYDIAMDFNARRVPEIVDAWRRETTQGWGKQILSDADFKRTLQTEYGIANPSDAPLMIVIDAWKKGADDIVNAAQRAGNNNRARVIGNMRDRVVDAVDAHNPAYAQARNAWSGQSKYLEAIEDGRSILSNKVSAEELTSKLSGMTDAQREAYRIGAVSAIRGKMGNDPAKLANMTKYLRSPETRAKIAAIMPTPEAAESWGHRLNFEVASSELTGRSLGNSATARRLAEQHQAQSIMGDLVMDGLSHGATMGLVQRYLMSVPHRLRDTLRSRSDRGLADILTNPGDVTGQLRGIGNQALPASPLPALSAPVYGEQGAHRAEGGAINEDTISAQMARSAAAQRMRDAVRPMGGRQEGAATKVLENYLPHAARNLASLPERAMHAAGDLHRTGEYDAGPALEAAMMTVGAPGTPKGALGANIRAFHNSADAAKDFIVNKPRAGNTFGPAVYAGPQPQKSFGPHTYELNVGGKEAFVDVSNAADVARFNREHGTNLQVGGYFNRESEANQFADRLRERGFDRFDAMNADQLIESAIYNPSVIETLRQFQRGGIVYRASGGRVNASPSDAQKEAGNYRKRHTRIHGFDISIENEKGGIRSGVDKGGKEWRVRMPASYGYLRGTEGSDGDHVDCYIGPHTKAPNVYVIDQVDAETKKFDEHKCMIGFASKRQAVDTYRKAFSDGRADDRIGHVATMTIDEFRDWLRNQDTTRPAKEAA